MKTICTIVLTVGTLASLWAQEITVKGKIKQAVTGKGVVAKIMYKSYPTGGISGTFTDSTFSFSIFGSSKYVINVEAEGHTTNAVLIDPKEQMNHEIIRDIELTSTGLAIRLNHLIFDAGRAGIKPASFKELDELVALMKINSKMEIQLEGHTDNLGNANANMKLSQDRVEAVKKYLTGKGIKKERIKTLAFGGTKPVSTENTEAARALNRRVEMRVLKQ
ncbi:MAG: OmpA family protein [Bacteroidetes bacterium]|nr:OmpA family protein [Bacteroidota bacterium]MBS1540954.1 OmpA family protein [Bacteroidota bacterium]